MTLLDEPGAVEAADDVWRQHDPIDEVTVAGAVRDAEAPSAALRPALAVRPLAAATLTSVSAALLVGGIFDSWTCRSIGVFGVGAGAASLVVVARARRQLLAQLVTFPALLVIASLLLTGADGGPSDLSGQVRAAFRAGRLLRPPIPFDPGWRPVVFLLLAVVAYSSAWIGTELERPLLGAIAPLGLALLAAFTQPSHGQLLAAASIFMPLLAALGVLFSASRPGSEKLDMAFEAKRAVKASVWAVPALGLLIAFNSLGFLFPATTIDPNDRPQKPRPQPLSSVTDRVLFRVEAPPGFSGPWRTGVLDVYDEGTFKLPGQSSNRLVALPPAGLIDPAAPKPTVHIKLTTVNLGDSPILPLVPTTVRVTLPPGAPADLRYDNRAGVLRVTAGRAPSNFIYTVDLPAYPNAQQLSSPPPTAKVVTPSDDLVAPPQKPPAVQRILRAAPPSGWDRLDYIRHQLLDHVTAAGPGAPAPMDSKRVQDLLDGSKKGTPYEIVAAQVLLARWAGFPARLAYGFNGFEVENGQSVIRPKDAAQWLEVAFPGFGFVPLLDKPPKADTTLDNPKKPEADVVASDEVAVELFLPVRLPRPAPLFEVVRARVLQALPLLVMLALLRALAPAAVRALRRRRREQWAQGRGPRARIGVAYAELRDHATDLNVGDPFATPIEYLALVESDEDHQELAWAVSRAMYGDLATSVSALDADVAEELCESLRRRLRSGQPAQTRILAFLSQGSLRAPYSDEVPNMTLPAPFLAVSRRWAVIRAERASARRRRQLARRGLPRRSRFRRPAPTSPTTGHTR